MKKNILVISAPSGGGKSVVANYLLANFSKFDFSISSTTRNKREGEINGKHYYFMSKENFTEKINNNEFIEYEEIFGNYYGTLHSEINRILTAGKYPLFDIDVNGAYSLKKHYPNDTVLIFLKPPSIEVLKARLLNRNTETPEQLQRRIQRAEMEISMSGQFDHILTNDNLDRLLAQVAQIVNTSFRF